MGWSVLDEVLAVFPNKLGSHPVKEIKVNIVKLKFLKRSTESTLDIFTLILPKLSGDKDIFSLNLASGDGLLNTLTYSFFVVVN